MQVNKLYLNNIEVPIFDSPIGLESINIALDRDFTYSCIDTKIEAELQFYCGSGKEYLDAEFEAKGIEASGHITIIDTCGTNAKEYTFALDFKRYSNKGDFTTVGLVDMNSLWKQDLNKEVNITTGGGNLVDFYVRNLPLVYDYESENVYGEISQNSLNTQHNSFFPNPAVGPPWLFNTTPPTVPPATAPPPPNNFYILYSHHIIPKVDQIVNQLEDSDGLLANNITITLPYNNVLSPNPVNYYYMEVVDLSNVSSFSQQLYTEFEPPALFSNRLDSGDFFLETNNTQIELNFNNVSLIATDLIEISEVISIGRNFENPRLIVKNLLKVTPATITSAGVQTYTLSKTFSRTFEVYELENVWIYYDITFKSTQIANPTWNAGLAKWDYVASLANVITFNDIKYKITNTIDCEFMLTKNVANSLTGAPDIEPYHTKTKAFLGQSVLNNIFGTVENIGDTTCYEDLWFSRGDYLRQKINVADFIVKPSDFFRELEKVVCCGLGYFYDNDPEGERKLLSVYDFYSDTLVPSQYQFDYNDLIDGEIIIEPFLSPFYNEVQIGYSNFKDSPKDFCKQNNYSIDNISESQYTKVSDFIASQYLITKALRLGTEDKELEFDKNIFILSGKNVTATPINLNVTLSQTSGFLADNIFAQPNTAGINRRYATALNLFRHLYKWGFSLFADKDKLTVNKYEGNSIYDYDIRDTISAMPTTSAPDKAESYHGLSACYLPYYNHINSGYVKVDRTIDNIYDKYIKSGLYVPTQITFKTANLSSLDIIDMRAHQYKLFSVTDGTNTYYGNLISAILEDDVTEIKLLRRFKDGII